ncbi:hypothetical protein HK103_005783 [Boothiomyces macroporosus]|uniref:Ribosomal protein L28 n=1 Tax=Boothiomyces macroporosus TaxID=261099 RepID=A0AAD5Y747_9FUNG|nr:hypothetical protein HK103_005783 [Boothiomyces macroporosus]
MGLSPQERIWKLGKAVSQNAPLANPRRWGKIPYDLRIHKQIMPVLLHGKRITFGNIQSKHSTARRSFIPNIIYKALYSKSLDMMVWTCLSAAALREIDLAGGFDEYILSVSDKYLGDDPITLMYKKRIAEITSKNEKELNESMTRLLGENYGQEYLEKIKRFESFKK